jgi:hypothetical protein
MSSKLLGGRNRQKSPRLRSARAFATEVGGDEAIRHNARHRCPSDHAGRNAAGARYWLKTSSFSTRHLDENPPWLLPWSTPQRAAGRRGTRHVLGFPRIIPGTVAVCATRRPPPPQDPAARPGIVPDRFITKDFRGEGVCGTQTRGLLTVSTSQKFGAHFSALSSSAKRQVDGHCF